MPNSSSRVDLSAFERLLTDISSRFVNAAPANVDAQITGALRTLVEFLGVDRSTLFQLSDDGMNLESKDASPFLYSSPGRPCRILFAGLSTATPSVTRASLSFRQTPCVIARSSRSTEYVPICRSR
jgi:hypothetical protein